MPPPLSPEDAAGAALLAQKQLGDLQLHISPEEYRRVYDLTAQLYPLRQTRIAENRARQSRSEKRLIERLHALYEDYSVAYLGGKPDQHWADIPQETLAAYDIDHSTGTLTDDPAPGDRSEDDDQAMWGKILGIFPPHAWDSFSKFTLFTDGEDEVLAWVLRIDDSGDNWELAVDPADAGDDAWFTETILHEYCHYLTLNDSQVQYGAHPTAASYFEEDMVALKGSYLDDFYQEFWTPYLDDRLQNVETSNFFYRHPDDFVTEYASTSPTEDICESFANFLLGTPQQGDALWQAKLQFFYEYPALVTLRQEVRANLGLEP